MGDSLRYRVKVALKNISNHLSSYLHVDGTSNKNILPLNCLFEVSHMTFWSTLAFILVNVLQISITRNKNIIPLKSRVNITCKNMTVKIGYSKFNQFTV